MNKIGLIMHMPRLLSALAMICGILALSSGCGPSPEGSASSQDAAATANASPPSTDMLGTTAYESSPEGAPLVRSIREEILRSGLTSEEAIASLKNANDTWPDEEEVITVLETALGTREDWAGLSELYESLPTLDVQRQSLYGQALLELARYQEASAVLIPLSDAKPYDLSLLLAAASAEYGAGRIEESGRRIDQHWEGIVANDQHEMMALRGRIFFDMQQYERARSLFEQALAIDASLSARESHDGLIRSLQALGETDAAKQASERLDGLNRSAQDYRAYRSNLETKLNALHEAWRDGDIERSTELIEEMLDVADEQDRLKIAPLAIEVYEASGRSEDVAAMRALLAEDGQASDGAAADGESESTGEEGNE